MPARTERQRRFMAMCSSERGRRRASKRCPTREIAREFMRKKVNEEAPANATGAPVSGTANPDDKSTPKAPMLFNRSLARKEIEKSKMLRRKFAGLAADASQK